MSNTPRDDLTAGNYDNCRNEGTVINEEPHSARSAPPRLTYVQRLEGARERRDTIIQIEQAKALSAGNNQELPTIRSYCIHMLFCVHLTMLNPFHSTYDGKSRGDFGSTTEM